jgi:hypothetical protein
MMDHFRFKKFGIKKGEKYSTEIRNITVDFKWFNDKGNMSREHSMKIHRDDLEYNNIINNITLLLPRKYADRVDDIKMNMACFGWTNIDHRGRKWKGLGNVICKYQIIYVKDDEDKYIGFKRIHTPACGFKDSIVAEIIEDLGGDIEFDAAVYFIDLSY